jgi:hypothetical protein
MTRSNKEVVQIFFASLWSDPELARSLAHDDVTWITTRSMPIPGNEKTIFHVGWGAVLNVANSGKNLDVGYRPETMEHPHCSSGRGRPRRASSMCCKTRRGRDHQRLSLPREAKRKVAASRSTGTRSGRSADLRAVVRVRELTRRWRWWRAAGRHQRATAERLAGEPAAWVGTAAEGNAAVATGSGSRRRGGCDQYDRATTPPCAR